MVMYEWMKSIMTWPKVKGEKDTYLKIVWLGDPEHFSGLLRSSGTEIVEDVIVSFILTLPADSRLL